MKWSRIIAVLRKEVFHILRDPFTLALALALPLILVLVFGLAIEFNIRELRMAVHDGDRTYQSRGLTEVLGSSGYFKLTNEVSPVAAMGALEGERAKAALIIEKNFGKQLGSEQVARAQVLLDGSDNSTVGLILGYLNGVQKIAEHKFLPEVASSNLEIRTKYLFNGELNSRWFTVPGLLAIVIAILSILLTSLTIAREWENGSMELLLSTPIRPLEIVIGKLVPYLVLGLGAATFVYLLARLGFGVPFRGSHFVLIPGVLLFITAYLTQGLLISVITRRQQLAMQLSMMTGLLPSILLSGFIFPIENMPPFFQVFTSILPAKWFIQISRGTFLSGSGFAELATPFLALFVLNGVLIMLATKNFKKDLEP
ncbi:MAG TPA: ABC transporter permease [Bdellovibrionales bacterium]|nr:MAG: multidrug ABC transporter permease [Bdellovibrionales bacterium GWB1_52_6]OFZ04939.1 MAG: multidrug ABC transporter permease [Bdellovibrionales bacterium GWA1_52_35]OFZ35251.1 MAG: multidrug ABC transporter permease [Bdellovibrionales bacterium GWC1_52_8]HAR41512.1 ABC transporter permease [Bdellovibrionales bacterium]HCM38850.1 ABC transporter permease [Bdellovibrionales bacterium]